MGHFSRLEVLGGHLRPLANMSRLTGAVTQLHRRNLCENKEKASTVLTEKQGNIFLIGLNRPESRNAVNRETAFRLRQAFEYFDKDKELNVAVFYGVGNTFCAGYDLKELSSFKEYDKKEVKLDPFGPMGPSKMHLSKPVIAAVSGHAVAGGLELTLMCDMRVAEKSAVFGVFCRRFGVPLIDGGTVRLPHLIGLSRALDLILTGRPVHAEEAHTIGLVNRVVPDGTALEHAITLAKQISAFPQGCLRADRQSAYHSVYNCNGIDQAMKFEFANGSEILSSESLPGATSFVKGHGRGGSFDL